jgi:ribonuclease HI
MAETKSEPLTLPKPNIPQEDWYILKCDGGARGNPGPAAIGVVLRLPDGEVVSVYKCRGVKTNNEAEYDSLAFGLWLAEKRGAHKVLILMDSKLVVEQVRGCYRVKAPGLKNYWDRVTWRLDRFDRWSIQWIPREQNIEADALVNLALDREAGKRRRA